MEEDYSGCVWTDGSPEVLFPTWLSSFEETCIIDNMYNNVYSPNLDCYSSCVPLTPEVLVLTNNNVELSIKGDNITETPEMCNCCICSNPAAVVLHDRVL